MQETSRGSTPLPFDRRMEGEAIYRRTVSGEDGSEGGNGVGRAALDGASADAAQVLGNDENLAQRPIEDFQAGSSEHHHEAWLGCS
jgi:hypothetical protein